MGQKILQLKLFLIGIFLDKLWILISLKKQVLHCSPMVVPIGHMF